MKLSILLLIIFCASKQTIAQKLSLNEFLNLKSISLFEIDSIMAAKKFERSDTSAGNLKFRFYGHSKLTGKDYELRYLQIAVNPDETFAEMQYQTSIKTESAQMQQELVAGGFTKHISTNSSQVFTFSKDDEVIIYSNETFGNSITILYTFSIRDNKKAFPQSLFKHAKYF